MIYYKSHLDSNGNEITIAYVVEKSEIKLIGTTKELPVGTIIPKLIIPSSFSDDGIIIHQAIKIKSDVFFLSHLQKTIKKGSIFILNPADVTIEELVIESGIRVIEEIAFINANVKRVYWPDTCKAIRAETFSRSKVEEIYGIENVETLCANALHSAFYLKNFSIPPKCTMISNNCFEYCKSLTKIDNTKHIVLIGAFAFANSGIEHFDWPYKCKAIPYRCFSECNSLKSISGVSNVRNISNGAFYRCVSLERFDWPENMLHVPGNIFLKCNKLKTFNVTGPIVSIGRMALSDTSIKEIDISKSLSTVLEVSNENDDFNIIQSVYQTVIRK